jgi:hypothetical protein
MHYKGDSTETRPMAIAVALRHEPVQTTSAICIVCCTWRGRNLRCARGNKDNDVDYKNCYFHSLLLALFFLVSVSPFSHSEDDDDNNNNNNNINKGKGKI